MPLFGKDRIVVIEYDNEKAYQSDANKKRKQGYEIKNVTSEEKRPSCLALILTGGIGYFLFKRTQYTVTYELVESQ